MLKRFLFFTIFIILTGSVYADWQIGMQDPASEVASIQQDLNVFMMWIVTIISIVVFGMMFYSIIYHRKSKGHKASNFHESTLVEIIWTAVPMLIIIGMALPATSAILKYKDTSEPDITIKVTGYQWKWSYDYLDQGVSFYSQLATPVEEIGGLFYGTDKTAAPESENYLLEVDNEMVVPVGKKVRLLFTAGDVIHAWWVPQLGVKQDAIPGLVRDGWFTADRTGIFRGQCAELCGKNHGFMPIVVRAVEEEEFKTWLADKGGIVDADADTKPLFVGQAQSASSSEEAVEPAEAVEWSMDTAMTRGESTYNSYCAACHQVGGEGLEPTFPALKDSPFIKEEGVAKHIDVVVNGAPGTAMAAFNYLSDEDLAALITYERNAWGNDTGDLVTPEDVAAGR